MSNKLRSHPGFILRSMLTLVACAILVSVTAAPAKAVYYPHGMNWQSFCVKHQTANARWITAYNSGRAAWNNHASFPGHIRYDSSCTSYIEAGSYGGSWLGLYTPLTSGIRFRMRLDSTNIDSHVQAHGYVFSNVARSVVAHEFGHSLRLGDHSNYPTRLMSSARNRNVVTSPTTVEVNESNSYY